VKPSTRGKKLWRASRRKRLGGNQRGRQMNIRLSFSHELTPSQLPQLLRTCAELLESLLSVHREQAQQIATWLSSELCFDVVLNGDGSLTLHLSPCPTWLRENRPGSILTVAPPSSQNSLST
jgi:hypothetical protein